MVFGSDNASDENSRYPVKIALRGFLNTDPPPESLGLVSLGLNSYSGIYEFDVPESFRPESVEELWVPVSAILRRTGKYVSVGLVLVLLGRCLLE